MKEREVKTKKKKRRHTGKSYQDITNNVYCPMCGNGKFESQGRVGAYDFKECQKCGFVFCPEITPE